MECTQTFSFLGGNILIFDSELNISSHVFITVQRQTLCWNSLSQYKTTQGILRLETCVTERNDMKCQSDFLRNATETWFSGSSLILRRYIE